MRSSRLLLLPLAAILLLSASPGAAQGEEEEKALESLRQHERGVRISRKDPSAPGEIGERERIELVLDRNDLELAEYSSVRREEAAGVREEIRVEKAKKEGTEMPDAKIVEDVDSLERDSDSSGEDRSTESDGQEKDGSSEEDEIMDEKEDSEEEDREKTVEDDESEMKEMAVLIKAEIEQDSTEKVEDGGDDAVVILNNDRPCVSTFSLTSFDIEGDFSTRGGPTEGDCSFVVRKQTEGVCKISVHFNRVGECDSGFAFIFAGERFCGKELEGKAEVFDFTGEMAFINLTRPDFVEVSKENEAYYSVTVRQIDCDGGEPEAEKQSSGGGERPEEDGEMRRSPCDRTFSSREFVMQSPDYPFPYPNDLDCLTTVLPADDNICSLELRFDEFRVEPSEVLDECANDYFEVSDDEPLSRTMRYCGSFTGIRLLEMGSLKRFRFHTNSNVTAIGYSIFVSQVACEFPQVTTTTTRRPTITTTTFPTTTTTEDVTERTLPSVFTTTPTTTSRPLTTRPPLFTTTTTTHRNPFLTSTTRRPPFSTVRPDTCSGTYLAAPRARIISPNYPGRYPNDAFCRYKIRLTRPDICFLQVAYASFDLELSINCFKDYFQIYDNKMCGSRSGSMLYPVLPGADSVDLTFRSDGFDRRRGFDITVSQVPCEPRPPVIPTTTTRPPFKPPFTTTTSKPPFRPPFSTTARPPVYSRPSLPTPTPPPTFRPPFSTTARPSFVEPRPPYHHRPHLPATSTHRPPFHPAQTTEPAYHPPHGTTNAHRPAYHAPKPSYNDNKPSYNPPKPSYHAPKPSYNAPKPSYHHQPKPSYNRPSRPSSHHHSTGSRSPRLLEQLVDAKRDLINGFLSIFRKPRSNNGQHHTSSHGPQPRPGYGAPRPAYGGPKPTYGAPKPTYGVPKPTYGAPKPTYGAPNPSYNPPKATYGAPQPSYGPPKQSGNYEAPKPNYAAPNSGYDAPPSALEPTYSAPASANHQSRPPAAQYQTPSLHQEVSNHVDQVELQGDYAIPAGIGQDAPVGNQYRPPLIEDVHQNFNKQNVLPSNPFLNDLPVYTQGDLGQISALPRYPPPLGGGHGGSGVVTPPPPVLNPDLSLPILECGSSTQAAEFNLRSPNYPSDYPDGADCDYRILPASVPGGQVAYCALRLRMPDFIVEESAGCRDDFLQLGNGARLCGQQSGGEVTLPLSPAVGEWSIRFKSDSRGTCRGYFISARQVTCEELAQSGGGVIGGGAGVLPVVQPAPPLPIITAAPPTSSSGCPSPTLAGVEGTVLPQGGEQGRNCEYQILPIERACKVDFVLRGLSFGRACVDFFVSINEVPFCVSDGVTSLREHQTNLFYLSDNN